MDPNAVLQELRELYEEVVLAGEYADGAYILDLFAGLDNWLTSGGFLPAEWTR